MRAEFEIVAAYAITMAYGLFIVDQSTSLLIFNTLAVATPIWILLSNVGSMVVWLFVAAGIFFWGQFSSMGRKLRGRTAGAVLFFGIWFNAAVAFLLKNMIARPRPPYELSVFELVHDYGTSMPSGHAQMAFMAAMILGYYYPKARTPLLAFAVLIALSRVGIGAHWVLDVLVGAANGLLIAALWLGLPWNRMGDTIQKIF
ncbi:MAG: phosphatase PAP2 family protein [Candidatus Aenigmatarchaeota archaeon]|nr:phosphatase PAP2 family protein [Candidatus Aenigmarchaeota archaeon]